MQTIILTAKSALALTLLVAGAAKLAGLPSFSETLRLFLPRSAPPSLVRSAGLAIVAIELLSGALSLSSPGLSWVNVLVIVLCGTFVCVSAAGYVFFRGHSCQCFGALSRRKFDLLGIGRSVTLLALAVLAAAPVGAPAVRLVAAQRILLLLAAICLSWLVFTAARALESSQRALRRG